MTPARPVPTAASGISATDLMLHEIGASHGADLAGLVGDMLSYGSARPTGGRQRVSVRARWACATRSWPGP